MKKIHLTKRKPRCVGWFPPVYLDRKSLGKFKSRCALLNMRAPEVLEKLTSQYAGGKICVAVNKVVEKDRKDPQPDIPAGGWIPPCRTTPEARNRFAVVQKGSGFGVTEVVRALAKLFGDEVLSI